MILPFQNQFFKGFGDAFILILFSNHILFYIFSCKCKNCGGLRNLGQIETTWKTRAYPTVIIQKEVIYESVSRRWYCEQRPLRVYSLKSCANNGCDLFKWYQSATKTLHKKGHVNSFNPSHPSASHFKLWKKKITVTRHKYDGFYIFHVCCFFVWKNVNDTWKKSSSQI